MAVFLSGQLRPSKSKQAIIFRMFFVFVSLSTLVSISNAAPAVVRLSVRETTPAATTPTTEPMRVTVCLPMTSTELIQQLWNINNQYTNLQIIPLTLGGSTFTVGVLDETIDLLNNKELSECVTTYALKELPNRFPRYILVTECDLSCNDDTETYEELENKKLVNQFDDKAIAVNTLHLEKGCDEDTGKDTWSYDKKKDVVFISQCKLHDR